MTLEGGIPTLTARHSVDITSSYWSKPLPGGGSLALSDAVHGSYLHHGCEAGSLVLASDSVIQTFIRWKSLRHITSRFSDEENERFMALSYTIGGMMVFPGQKIDGRQTINGARGFNSAIKDRFDLTLECIRRHYVGEGSPLADTLSRYADFFAMFRSFSGYVDFFLLQDLLSEDGRVNFFLPFIDFQTSAAPQSEEQYREYRRLTVEFVQARNRRIAAAATT